MRDVFDGDEDHRKKYVESAIEYLKSFAPAEDPAIIARKQRATAKHLAWLDHRDGLVRGGALYRTTAGDGGQRDD